MNQSDLLHQRWEPAPISLNPPKSGKINGIWLKPDEYVEWLWTDYLDGTRQVTGYIITKKDIDK